MTRRTDTYTAVTPFGAVEVDFPEDGGSVFVGDAGAVEYLKSVIEQCVGQGGIRLTPDTIEPIDFTDFCQPKGSGILIIEPFDLMMEKAMSERAPALDSAAYLDQVKSQWDTEVAAKEDFERKSMEIRDQKSSLSLTDSAQAATNLIAQPPEKTNGNEAAQALKTETQGSQAPTPGNPGQLDAVTIPDDGLEADDLEDAGLPDAVDEQVHDLVETAALDAVKPAGLTLSEIRERASIDRELLAMGMVPEDGYLERTYGAGWKMGAARVAPVLDDASMNRIAPVDPTITALAAVAGRMASMVEAQNAAITTALNARPAPIEFTMKNEPMTVKIEQPASVVHLTMPEFPQAPAAQVVVHLPEQAAPAVHITNEVPAAQVVMSGPARSISEVQRDPVTQEILRTVTTHEAE
jgi:hypothetical protein